MREPQPAEAQQHLRQQQQESDLVCGAPWISGLPLAEASLEALCLDPDDDYVPDEGGLPGYQ